MNDKQKSEEDVDKSQDLSEDVIGILREENEKLKKQLECCASKELTKSVLEGAHAQMRKIADSAGSLMREASEGCDSIAALLSKLGKAKLTNSSLVPFKHDKTKDGWTCKDSERGSQRITSADQIKNLISVSFLEKGESYVNGEVMLQRAKERKLDFSQYDLEYLLENQKEIPKKLRDFYLVFPGTVWRGSGGGRRVADLRWGGGEWCLDWGWGWLGRDWRSGNRLLSVGKS